MLKDGYLTILGYSVDRGLNIGKVLGADNANSKADWLKYRVYLFAPELSRTLLLCSSTDLITLSFSKGGVWGRGVAGCWLRINPNRVVKLPYSCSCRSGDMSLTSGGSGVWDSCLGGTLIETLRVL